MSWTLALTFISDLDYGGAKLANEIFNFSSNFVTQLLKIITYMGNGGLVFIVIAVLLLLFKKTRLAGFMALISLLIGFILTNIILKNIVARPRPFIDETSDFYVWWQQAGSIHVDGHSFPSGHATAAMAFSLPLFIVFNKKYSWLYLLIPLLMSFTRVYFMVHFTSDVIAGMLVGALAGIGAYFAARALQKITFISKGLELPSVMSVFVKKAK